MCNKRPCQCILNFSKFYFNNCSIITTKCTILLLQLIFTSLHSDMFQCFTRSSSGSAPMFFLQVGSLGYLCLLCCSFFMRLVVNSQMVKTLNLSTLKLGSYKRSNYASVTPCANIRWWWWWWWHICHSLCSNHSSKISATVRSDSPQYSLSHITIQVENYPSSQRATGDKIWWPPHSMIWIGKFPILKTSKNIFF
jgi:hypothetical protein